MLRAAPLLTTLLLAAGAAAAPAAHAAAAPFLIPDVSDVTLGPGLAGNTRGGRLAIEAFDDDGPRFRPPVVWTVGLGRRKPLRHPLTRAHISGEVTFTPTGALVAHSVGKAGAVAVATLDAAGHVLSDPVVSGNDRGAAPVRPPLIGADGTVAVHYEQPPGDAPTSESLTLQPHGTGAWTPPVALPAGDVSNDVQLARDGTGAVVSVPHGDNHEPVVVHRFGADGVLGPPITVDLTAVRPLASTDFINSAVTITDAGTVVIALGVPGATDDRHVSHLLLVTIPPGAGVPTTQVVGAGVDGNGGAGTLAIAPQGVDGATVIASDGAAALRVFDTTAAGTGIWTPSTIPATHVRDGQAFRQPDGCMSVVWAHTKTTGLASGGILATHRPPGGTFVAPHPLSKSPRARGNVDLFSAAQVTDGELLVAYGKYGSDGQGDRSYALIGHP